MSVCDAVPRDCHWKESQGNIGGKCCKMNSSHRYPISMFLCLCCGWVTTYMCVFISSSCICITDTTLYLIAILVKSHVDSGIGDAVSEVVHSAKSYPSILSFSRCLPFSAPPWGSVDPDKAQSMPRRIRPLHESVQRPWFSRPVIKWILMLGTGFHVYASCKLCSYR